MSDTVQPPGAAVLGADVTVRTEPPRDAPAAPPDRHSPPRSRRRRDIQGLRAVAVLLVVAFHAGLPVSGGFIGVDVFFVISGFVITAMLLRELGRDARLDFARFYRRRVRRLLPALAVLLVFVAVGSTLFLDPYGTQQTSAKSGLAASLFGANLYLWRLPTGGYFDLASDTNPLLHMWSLSVEEQFYLLFPALLAVGWRIGRRLPLRWSRRSIAAIVSVVTVASFALSYVTSHGAGSQNVASFAFYSPLTRAWEFGVGALLAVGAATAVRFTRQVHVVLGLAGAVLIGVGASAIDGSTPFPGTAALRPVLGTALVIAAGTHPEAGGVTSALSVRPAVWIGDVSYGWYLWHWPLIVFAAALWPGAGWALVAVGVASLVPTWLSYRFVEEPIRSDDRRWAGRAVRLAGVCIAVPIMAGLGVVAVNRLEKRTGDVRRFAAATASHRYGPPGCDASTLDPARACTWSVDDPKGSIYLLGDSNAGQFAEPVARAGNELGYDVTVGSVGGCWFALVVNEWDESRECYRFVTESLAALRASPPDLVILAASTSSTMLPTSTSRITDARTGRVSTTPDERSGIYADGLASVLRQLAVTGTPSVVVHTVPNLADDGSWVAATCPALEIYRGSCGIAIDRSAVERQQRPARDAEVRAVAAVPLASTVDFTDELCPLDRCSAEWNGVWMYRDATHLSVDGALRLTERFRAVMTRRLRRR